jgi:imidazolonepropionase-like amidohydrolase
MAAPSTLILKGALLIDGTGAEPLRNQTITIEDGVIRKIGPGPSRPPSDAEVIDVEGRAVMPGLIDAHTHLTYHAERPNVWVLETQESVELNTLYAARNAAHILATGVTTIGDGGCRGYIGPAIRDGVRQGLCPGPDIVAAGPIICGAAGLLDGAPPWLEQHNATSLGMTADGPEAVRAAVRRQIKGGVDWIKVAASGVAGSPFSSAETDDLGAAEIEAAVSEARKYRRLVHAHAHSRGGILAAARAGAVSIHSAEFADEECLDELAKRGTIFSPTIAWLHVRCIERYGAPPDPAFRKEAWRAFDASRTMIAEARRRGVRIALGSDAAHRFPHVPSAVVELEYLEALGYPPLEVVRAATETAAAAVGRGDRTGRIAPGLAADLLVVDGNPAEGVGVLRDSRRLSRIYRAGRRVDETALKEEMGRRCTATPFAVREWLDRSFGELQQAA